MLVSDARRLARVHHGRNGVRYLIRLLLFVSNPSSYHIRDTMKSSPVFGRQISGSRCGSRSIKISDLLLLLLISILVFLTGCQVSNQESEASPASSTTIPTEIPEQIRPSRTNASPTISVSQESMAGADATESYEQPSPTPNIRSTDTPMPTATPRYVYSGPPISRYDVGVQVHITNPKTISSMIFAGRSLTSLSS